MKNGQLSITLKQSKFTFPVVRSTLTSSGMCWQTC